ncbi:alpha/beta hydrolase [Winogradskya consettensis]|uniref:Hydrolase YraK n=1 Tax=Winogradskya consettensis TaxID=113560 RepID=A0A919SDA5_9ACTN|nr:alpha/beta hydrolase [Actinoplanes consettensis]GIM69572.1 putative hydrolase YraK [Actinoplanes consettensis]
MPTVANLYYEIQGSGPMLLLGQSGEGDAHRTADLASLLSTTHTVITYDRRGLSRSAPVDPGRPPTLTDHADHADDASRLLDALTDKPVAMLGCSLGASIGLHLAVRHPGKLHTLIAHEPVSPWLLPPAEQASHERELLDIQRLYLDRGLTEAMREVARVLGIDPTRQPTEPGLTPHPMTPQRIANFDTFLRHDLAAIATATLQPADLPTCGTRIIPALGTTTPPAVFDHLCAHRLAEFLSTPPVPFPGGHNGNTTHPHGYAESLRNIL